MTETPQNLEGVRFFPFSSDNSTDIVEDEQESVHKNGTHCPSGTAVCWIYFSQRHLILGGSFDTVVNGLNDRKVWHDDKIVSIGCDGVSTNLGMRNGMVTLLKKARKNNKYRF